MTRLADTGYGLMARLLHWVMAALILCLLGLGIYMANFEKDGISRITLTQTHKSFGFVAFCLAVLRVIWRQVSPPPPLPDAMPPWQVKAAHLSHAALYVLMIALPLTGWLMATSSPLPLPNRVFDLFDLPDFFTDGSERVSGVFRSLHFTCALALIGLLAAHVVAALKHQFVDRDGLLMRMIRG